MNEKHSVQTQRKAQNDWNHTGMSICIYKKIYIEGRKWIFVCQWLMAKYMCARREQTVRGQSIEEIKTKTYRTNNT